MKIDITKVKFTDDKKEKYQSVEANYLLDHYTAMGHCNIMLTGYGETEDEALQNMVLAYKEANQKEK